LETTRLRPYWRNIFIEMHLRGDDTTAGQGLVLFINQHLLCLLAGPLSGSPFYENAAQL
jgi:hypothetical protein